MRRVPLPVVLLLALVFVSLAGCSGDRPSLAAADPAATATTEPGKLATVESRAIDLTVVATAVVPMVAVYGAPDALEPVRTLANPLASGGPLVLVVERAGGAWLQVVLPTSPPGSLGWVRAADVTIARHNYRMAVHLSEYRLDVFLAGQIVRQIKLGEGSNALPIAGGRYYTTELLQPAQPDPIFGSFAYGLSGWSDPMTTFAGEVGQLGVHGTSEPDTIGTQTTSGSLRMRNEDIEDLSTFLPLGVPVTVS